MERILSIAKKPGLYRMVNRGKNTLVVEVLGGGRRMPVFATDKITSLNDITIYTQSGDLELWKVFAAMAEKENKAKVSLDYRNCDPHVLRSYFEELLPEYDRDRVHDSDMRRIMQWYDTLVEAGYSDFGALMGETEE